MAALQMGVLCLDRGRYVQFAPGSSLLSNLSDSGTGLRKKKMKVWMNKKCYRTMSVSMSKTDVDNEVEFKPSFGQYLKVMETVKIKRKERKEKSFGEKGDGLGEGSMGKDGERFKADTVEEKRIGLPVFGGSVAVEKFGKTTSVRKGLKNDELRKNTVTSQNVVNFRNDEVRPATNVKWTRNREGTVKENLNDFDKEERKTEVWKNQESPRTRENSIERRNDLHSGYKANPYDGHDEFSHRERISYEQKGKIQKFETQERYKKDDYAYKTANRRSGTDMRNFKKTYNNTQEITDGDGFGLERAAFKTLEVIDEGRVSRMLMEERLQRLAKMLNGADIDMPEWMFSRTMRSAQIRFTDHSITRVIQVLGKLGNWRRALQVIEWLQMSERFKSHKLRFIYTAALDVLGKARRPVEALNVFTAMQQQMASYPDLVAYHSIAVTLGQAGHIKELFNVIDIMKSPPRKNFNKGVFEKWDPRLEPDIVVYNAVLNACVKRKNWEGAFWVLQQLDQQKIQLSSTTYGLIMEVMYASEKYNLVHEFFEKMKKSFIPNALTYRVLVNTLWKEGKPDEAVQAVCQMERRGIVGSAALYYDLARCLCSMGRCQEALMQMEKISKVANKPLIVTYTGLIQSCLDSGNVHDAKFILSRMNAICSPNLVTYNIMVKAYIEGGLLEEAKELYLKMSDINNRVLPDIYTFNTILDACASAEQWDDFEYFYEEMFQYGFHFNAKRHLRMILDAARANKGELVETTWTHLAHSGRAPPVSLILERFLLKLEKDDVAAATSCITSLASDDTDTNGKVKWVKIFKDNAHRIKQDSIVRLMNEIARRLSDFPCPVFDILKTCCEDFLKNSASTGVKVTN